MKPNIINKEVLIICILLLVSLSGDPSAGVCSALVGPAGGGAPEEGAGPAAGLAGAAGEEEEGGEGGAAERPPPSLDEPAEEGGLQPAVPSSGE